jgi:hypothetical protein
MTRKLRNSNNKSLHLVVFAVILLIVFSIQQQQLQATNYTTPAFELGYNNSRADYLEHGEGAYDPYCDPDNSAPDPEAYCNAYIDGYEAGWQELTEFIPSETPP